MPFQPIELSTKVAPTLQQTSLTLAGQEVILHQRDGIYYGLNESGSWIWQLIKTKSRTIVELKQAMLEQFDITDAQCEQDLLALLTHMRNEGLVQFEA